MTGEDKVGIDARRIVRNTTWLYVRLAVITLADLIAVRVVIKALGVSGFGVYAAVSGAVSLIFFLQWTMELAVRRFLCVAIDGRNQFKLAETFTGGVLLALLLDAVFVIVVETAGRWFVLNMMSVNVVAVETVLTVMQLSVLACFVQVVRLPFDALIISSERMAFFAKISVVEALLSLGAVGAVALVDRWGVEAYSMLLLAKSIIVFGIAVFYCWRSFDRLFVCRGGALSRFLEQAVFFAKSIPSDVANMFKNEGVNMLVNVYAGVAFNASWKMSMRLGSGLYGLVANFQQAFFPQIVKLWGHDDKRPFVVLMAGTMRWSAIIMGLCVLPLFVLTQPILSFWLGDNLPPEAIAFTRCASVYIFFDALIGPLHTVIVATGKVFVYNLCISVVMASSFFGAWGCLAVGLPTWTSVGVVAFVNALAFLYRLYYVRRHLGVRILPFLRKAFVPANML